MNKKIYKGYELAEAVDNGILSLEQKVKNVDNMTYFECTIDFVLKDVAKNIMFEYFELLEDNTEGIEELEFTLEANDFTAHQLQYFYKMNCKINELGKEINRIRKEKE